MTQSLLWQQASVGVVLAALCACPGSTGVVDASVRDAGRPPTMFIDASIVADAGTPDAGALPDAGSFIDAGTSSDAGASFDAGIAIDSGSTTDAGPIDSGTPLDAGANDAGPSVDAGLRPDAGATFDAGAPLTLTVTVLDAGVIDRDGRMVAWQALRLTLQGKQPAYVHWFPPPSGLTRPVVVLPRPYDGIDFTGEAVDARWAAQGPGAWPDIDSPDAGSNPGDIAYAPFTLAQAADETFVWHFHDFGVLLAYGRFYAGGDLANDRDDMISAMAFLKSAPMVDRAHIGVIGGSWGGFEALMATAHAPLEVTPAATVASMAPSDFAEEYVYATQTMPGRYLVAQNQTQCRAFFAPYLRRILATTHGSQSGAGDFTGFTRADLVSRITSPTMLVHEDWDSLVDFAQSFRLAQDNPTLFQLLQIRHATTPPSWDAPELINTHGPLLASYASRGASPLSTVFVLTRLGGHTQSLYVPYDALAFRQLLTGFHDRWLGGQAPTTLGDRLFELTDPRVQAYDTTDGGLMTGAALVADELARTWGWSVPAENLRARLDAGFP